MRPVHATALSLSALLWLLGLGCSSSETEAGPTVGGADGGPRPDLRAPGGGDAAALDDLAVPGSSCPTVQDWCADSTNPCVLSWSEANTPAAWCAGARTFNIFPEEAACPSGDHVIVLSNELAFGSRYFFYRGGVLVGVLGFPDDLSTGHCVAGDPTLKQADLNGCTPKNMVAQCVDGALL